MKYDYIKELCDEFLNQFDENGRPKKDSDSIAIIASMRSISREFSKISIGGFPADKRVYFVKVRDSIEGFAKRTSYSGWPYFKPIKEAASLIEMLNLIKEKETTKEAELKQAHVLFMDIVDYSKLKSDQQVKVITTLNRIVKDCLPKERRLMLPTGDGMAIAFLENPESPLLIARKISPKAKEAKIPLRMGMHTGPVYLVEDINKQLNLAGGGINLAQRVMSCGNTGHMLIPV